MRMDKVHHISREPHQSKRSTCRTGICRFRGSRRGAAGGNDDGFGISERNKQWMWKNLYRIDMVMTKEEFNTSGEGDVKIGINLPDVDSAMRCQLTTLSLSLSLSLCARSSSRSLPLFVFALHLALFDSRALPRR
uniref:Uncharacterized protein n=1 Tax=Ananas comosus var. bracteatus TaxID=296719 RepID=A0A6V7PK91_ANACO|nr:unnamed protein product [Ananas comosus var. bracteatus]